jgi:uridine kinase
MRGDTIIVEPHHRAAAAAILPMISPKIQASKGRYSLTVAGESGSGKSETATAIAELLAARNIASVILQQDDYFVYPPKSNDRARRKDIGWVGPQEVRLDLLDEHLRQFLSGAESIEKPLVIYEEDRIDTETLSLKDAAVVIAEGTYTTLLNNAGTRIFIDRSYEDTRAHREKRKRDAAELDPFIDKVLQIEHGIISAHKARADIVIGRDYGVTEVKRS